MADDDERRYVYSNGHCLTDHDRQVLGRIFSPFLPNDDDDNQNEIIGEPLSTPSEAETVVTSEARRLEMKGIEAAEKGDLATAESHFRAAIETAPDRASTYNNRAQARRLASDVAGAEEDLDRALELSSGLGNVACQAFTQRAIMHRLHGEDAAAVEDFKRAAALGSQFAKSQLIAMNPYAAMCSAMLSEMMTRLRNGEDSTAD